MDNSLNKIDVLLEEQLDLLIAEYKQKAIDIHEFVRLVDIMYKDFLDFHPVEREQVYARFRPK
jgi:hypothetical protein